MDIKKQSAVEILVARVEWLASIFRGAALGLLCIGILLPAVGAWLWGNTFGYACWNLIGEGLLFALGYAYLLSFLREYERKLMKANAEFERLDSDDAAATPPFDVIGDPEVDLEIGRMIAKTNRRLAQLKAKPIYSMVPPWVKYPIIPAKSIGWRIGGEPDKYLSEFRDWWSTLDTDQKETYREIYPAPESWRELCRKHGGEFFYDN